MQDSPDNHIDDFVRKVATQPDIQMEPGDWQAMAAMLDREMPVEAPVGGYWLYYSANVISILALIGILYIGLFGLDQWSAIDQNPLQPVDCELAEESEVLLVDEDCAETVHNDQKPESRATSQPVAVRSSQPFREKTNTPVHTESSPIKNQENEPPSETFLKLDTHHQQGRDMPPDSTRNEIEDEIWIEGAQKVSDSLVAKAMQSTIASDTAVTDSVFMTTETAKPAAPVKNRRLAIGVLMAPDFNSVGFGGETRASGLVGIAVIYRMAPRWVLSTGFQYNRKKYVTTGSEYAPPYGYWQAGTNGRVPDVVNGQCAVVDVPITVGYEWPLGRNLRLLSSAGLSTYLLQNEDYFFEFEQPNPGAAPGWSSDAKSSAVLGIANASVLVRWPVARRLNVSAGPYLKVPLQDIGWGSVRMYGSGAVVMILYDLF